jgi:hypothetical protein
MANIIESLVNSRAESKLGLTGGAEGNLGNTNKFVCGEAMKIVYNILQTPSSGKCNDLMINR